MGEPLLAQTRAGAVGTDEDVADGLSAVFEADYDPAVGVVLVVREFFIEDDNVFEAGEQNLPKCHTANGFFAVDRVIAAGAYRAASRIGTALPPELYRQFRTENFGRRAARALQSEVRHFLPGLAGLRTTPPDLADLPVTTITTGAPAHTASAAALPHGRLVTAEQSGHNVMFDMPALVVEEILRVLP